MGKITTTVDTAGPILHDILGPALSSTAGGAIAPLVDSLRNTANTNPAETTAITPDVAAVDPERLEDIVNRYENQHTVAVNQATNLSIPLSKGPGAIYQSAAEFANAQVPTATASQLSLWFTMCQDIRRFLATIVAQDDAAATQLSPTVGSRPAR